MQKNKSTLIKIDRQAISEYLKNGERFNMNGIIKTEEEVKDSGSNTDRLRSSMNNLELSEIMEDSYHHKQMLNDSLKSS